LRYQKNKIMKLKMISIAIASLMSVTINNYAQEAQLSSPAEYKPLQQVKLFSGKIINWVSNQDYYYDGFYLQTENEKYLVRFSPRLGKQLTSALKIGASISINAVEAQENNERNAIRLVSITTSEVSIYNNLTAVVPAEEPIFGSGQIVQLQQNELGLVKGLILFDKTILRFPSNTAEQLNKIAVVGTFVSYTGSQILRNGEFAPIHYTIVQCKTITIEEKQYLVE
jgi:hypothetical protein